MTISITTLSIMELYIVLCCVAFMPRVTNKPFMLSVVMLNVAMLNVVMLNVMAPRKDMMLKIK